nr:hypothetical protein [Tanacetum cinerariifolium]
MGFYQALDLIFKLDMVEVGCTQDILRQSDCHDRRSGIPRVVPTFIVLEGEDIVAKFFSPSRWTELSKETGSKILLCGDGSCWKTLKRYHVVLYEELDGIPVALVARFGVVSKSTDKILVSHRGEEEPANFALMAITSSSSSSHNKLLELMLSKRLRKNTKCVNAADEELTVAKHKLMLLVY